MKPEKKRILITVKAYPNPSKKYGETVCCAGVDLNNSQLVRLYPIPFRDLDNDKKFKKYSIIEVDCFLPSDDKRPESFRVNADTINVVDLLDTEKGTWAKQSPSDQKAREACYAQLSFFDKKKDAIEGIPFNFYYKFKCAGVSNCPGHKLSIIDWEIGQSYRDWRAKYPAEQVLLEKIKQRWLDISNTARKDVYFYVGNMKRFRKTFIILGVFYPSVDKETSK